MPDRRPPPPPDADPPPGCPPLEVVESWPWPKQADAERWLSQKRTEAAALGIIERPPTEPAVLHLADAAIRLGCEVRLARKVLKALGCPSSE